MQPTLISEAVDRDRLAELVGLSHETELRVRRDPVSRPRASLATALIRAGLKLNPATVTMLSSRAC